MKIRLLQYVSDVPYGSPTMKQPANEGDEVEVTKEVGEAMVASEQAEVVKRRGNKAQEGPEETR
jgi:hypothetical protein